MSEEIRQKNLTVAVQDLDTDVVGDRVHTEYSNLKVSAKITPPFSLKYELTIIQRSSWRIGASFSVTSVLCTEMRKFLLQLCKLRKAAPLRRALVARGHVLVHALALAPLQMHCSMTASGAENWTDCWTDGCTSAAVECDRRGARENKVYSPGRRRELYTTGCSKPCEADMDGREVFL